MESGWALSVRGQGVAALRALPALGSVTVGRSFEATVPIFHVSLSRRHARLRFGRAVTIEDLGSRNGTVVGGCRLEPGEMRVVQPGEVMQLGAVSVTLVPAAN